MKLRVHPDSTTRTFWCPGCDSAHSINVGPAGWTCNDDAEHPTIQPSVLVHSHPTLVDEDLEGDALTASENIRQTPQCHSFVTDGRIQFLDDSTHALAGQTVDLPDWPS